jgi:PAS domain S-box-containing protein
MTDHKDPKAEGPSTAEGDGVRLIEGLRDQATFLLGPQGEIETWSQDAEHVTGYPVEEIAGKPMAMLYSPHAQAAGEPARELTRAEVEGRLETQTHGQRKDGRRFPAHMVLTAMRSRTGQLRGFVVVMRDLTEQRRVDRVLRLSEERFRALVNSVEDYAIFTVDLEGRVSSWNPGAARIKGYFTEEILGESIERFYPEEDRRAGKPRRLLREAAVHGRVEDEGWRVRKDGSLFWADVVVSAMRSRNGELLGYAKVTRDLSARRQAEEELRHSEERFRLLVEGVKESALYMIDPAGRVLTWNSGAERIEGYRASEIVGQHFSRFYSEEDVRAGEHERQLEVASQEGTFEEEGWRVRKDGSRFWASVVITALRSPSGELLGYAKVTRDLTQRRKLEEERVRLAQAEESIRLRDEFLSIASHELKTPLTALQLQLQGLQKKVAAVDPNLAGRLERAARSGQRLADLIEALLDVSRIATGRFELRRERFDMAQTVGDVVDRLRESAAREGCTVELSVAEGVVGAWDRLRIEQVLTNLLANAIKYGAGKPVRIHLCEEAGQAILQVGDRGPGIPEQDLARIFGRFERASSIRHYGGLGLGLYVAREIVQAHGGAVSAANAASGGALFTVRLPLEDARVESGPAESRSLH